MHVAGKEVVHRFTFRSGDLIFFNNMRMLHARDAFVDGCEEQNTTKRYVLRLILKGISPERTSDDSRNPPSDTACTWEVPPELKETWRELYEHEDEIEIISVKEQLMSYKAGH